MSDSMSRDEMIERVVELVKGMSNHELERLVNSDDFGMEIEYDSETERFTPF